MKKTIFFLLMLAMAGILSGCSENSKSDMAIDNAIILAGNHSNSIRPDYAMIKEAIENIAYKYGDVCVIVDDGDPYIAWNESIPEQKKGLSQSKRLSIAESQANQIIELLNSQECYAQTEGLDILTSFKIADRVLHTDQYLSERTIIYVFDTGLSTDKIDFTELDMEANSAEEIVEKLREEKMIPDLMNIDVVWYGLCDVAEPQEELTNEQREGIKEIWTAILNAAGANVQFKSDISTDTFDIELPSIKVVPSRSVIITWDLTPEPSTPPQPSREKIQFIPDRSEFVDYDEAVKVLEEWAFFLIEHPDITVYVIGTTATGNMEFCKELSTNRAIAVKEILVSYGVPESQLIPRGLGYWAPWHIPDEDEYGRQIEQYAYENRRVIIMDANGEDATKWGIE